MCSPLCRRPKWAATCRPGSKIPANWLCALPPCRWKEIDRVGTGFSVCPACAELRSVLSHLSQFAKKANCRRWGTHFRAGTDYRPVEDRAFPPLRQKQIRRKDGHPFFVLSAVGLLDAKGPYRIDRGGALGGDDAGDGGCNCENENRPSHHDGVDAGDVIEL
jgi:hypothetical protein